MKVAFSPIAVVGRACVLPGALSPDALWQVVRDGADQLGTVPKGRWRCAPEDALCGPDEDPANRSWSDRGGYVRGFEGVWDPTGFAVAPADLEGLDPLFHWALHCARAALADAGDQRRGKVDRSRVSGVFGNLGFPSSGMTRFAEAVWHGDTGGLEPRDRFMSGGAAKLVEEALGLAPGVMCLDTACASSLYAIKLACDQLHDGRVDLALAGAVNRADDLFIHVGFTALNAMSRSGQSRPFHADADGLVPAEGAGFVALKRLADARRDGDAIYGVIRGIGLSNDGRGRGFLAPSESGQRRALEEAYAQSGLRPSDVSLLEFHATGTTVGDAAEIRSTGGLFDGCADVPVGSLKSNLGHLITAAGVAGLIKVLEAMAHRQRPPSLHANAPNPALSRSPFRVLRALEDWHCDGVRVAGVSAFGFGGNNAHLLVSEDDPSLQATAPAAPLRVPLAIVGVGAVVGEANDRAAFTRAVLDNASLVGPEGAKTGEFELALADLRFPPRDLQAVLPQQLLLLKAAREAMADVGNIPSERTGVFVAMEPDVEVCRFGLRWRLLQRLRDQGVTQAAGAEGAAALADSIVATLTSAGVVGNMPNIPANRLNSQFDLGGGSVSISAGEASGLRTLAQAHRALSVGELDVALVGGVDLSCQNIHNRAIQQIQGNSAAPGDAAVVLVLKRLADAQRDGDAIVAVLSEGNDSATAAPAGLDERFGRSWAAGGLRDLMATALALSHRAHVDGRPWHVASDGPVAVTLGEQDRFTLTPHDQPRPAFSLPRLHIYAAADRDGLIAALDAGQEGNAGACRLVVLAHPGPELQTRLAAARRHVLLGTPPGPGVYYRASKVVGDVAFVFAGAGSAYAGMGQSLAVALPELAEGLAAQHPAAAAAIAAPWPEGGEVPPLLRLWSASALCQVHAALSQRVLGIRPDAVIGYSSGESNSLYATGTWTDLDAMIADTEVGRLFTDEIGGQMNAVSRVWGQDVQWETWTVLAPVDEVQRVVDGIAHVHLSVIHSDNDCIVAGDAAGCAEVCKAIGRHRCLRLNYDLAVHVPELALVREPWLALHRRKVTQRDGVRIYSAGYGAAYLPSEAACADAILAQADKTLDFRKVIEAAWADGVRVFVEHGPQGSCSRWILDILGDREAVVVALDRKGGGLLPVLEAVAALMAAGVDVDVAALLDRVALPTAAPGPSLRFSAHPAPVRMAALPRANRTIEANMQIMQPAPTLRPILAVSTLPERSAVAPSRGTGLQETPTPTPTAAPTQTLAPTRTPTPPPVLAQASALTVAAPAAESPLLFALRQQILAVTQSKQEHIARQVTAYQRFLEVQNQAMQLLVQGSMGAPQPALYTESGVESRAEAAPPAAVRPQPAAAPPAAVTPHPAAAPTAVVAPQPAAAPPTELAARTAVAPSAAPQPRPVHRPAPVTVAKKTAPATASGVRAPIGPQFDRSQLETHASGRISTLFGPMFAVQDDFHRQVRMPEPPLLLADRVTGLDAEPGSMGKGTLWSETDISPDAWYLHQGHIPTGIMIEAGQADLMLVSYLGVDFTNRNDRVYRLLGCELTYRGGLPKVGDTLAYDIHMDGYAKQGDIRLMFFHYDCRVDGQVRLSVRKGQAGFFTDAELADSDGCLWTPEGAELDPSARLDPPLVACTKSAFSLADVHAFANGRPFDCFGPGYHRSRTHTRTPRIQNGRMMMLGPIDHFSPRGGPWGRGFMRCVVDIHPDDWFFAGHFKNDPCMPGTLMLEGCLQLMAFYMAALGLTVQRDGWRFEPVSDVHFLLSCRGQVTPTSKSLIYELYVKEVHDGPVPKLVADLLCTVDGLKAFHAHGVALQLTPAWPLDEGSPLLLGHTEPKPVAKSGDFPFDLRSLIACANGRPSEAFGPIYRRFDGPGRVARLPNPPYLFMSRVVRTQGDIGSMATGMEVEVEYDIPPDAWYFDENGCRAMPFAVLLEAALQPCGWLASYLGSALTTDIELCFRNLDGKGTLHVDLLPDAGTLRTWVRSTGISRTASMIIVSFKVECSVGDVRVYDLDTVFGFFPQEALENQVGLPTSGAQRAALRAPANQRTDLTLLPRPDWKSTRPRLAEPMLLMLDRITHFDPKGGGAGLGSARGEKDVNPGEWFFKAHFFQDPVQPGSLGIEAMIQLLQWTMLEMGLDAGMADARFETLGLGNEMAWKYRGQVIPESKLISSTLELTEIRRESVSILVVADASLWVDGKRIYEAKGLGMRLVSGGTPDSPTRTLDPAKDTWLADHCPTWTAPALSMMNMVDLLAQGANAADPITALLDVRLRGWLTFDGPRTLRTRRRGEHVRLLQVHGDGGETEVASARVQTGPYGTPPAALPALQGEPTALPYETGELFHGPAFQVLESLVRTAGGASSVLRARSSIPAGRLNPLLLDGATHGIPHDQLHLWNADLSPDKVAYPALIPELRLYGPTPLHGTLRCEVRPDGVLGSNDFPAFQVQLIGDAGVWCAFRLVEACFDKGHIGRAPAGARRAFLRDRTFSEGVRTSSDKDGVTTLDEATVAAIDWLPGTVKAVYGSRDIGDIALREHIAAAHGVHPAIVPAGLPLQRFDLTTTRKGDAVQISGDGRGTLDLAPVVDFWTRWFNRDPWLVEDLYFGLIERFVGKVVLTDPEAFQAVSGRGLVYLGNHQVGVESLLFSVIASALGKVPTVTLAKAEHRGTWLGKLIAHCFAYPGIEDPQVITFFDREDKGSLGQILADLAREMTGPGRSVMVHVEGTRSLDCKAQVSKMSGAFVDLALGVNAPVVPIRFVGGLPRTPLAKRLEFPLGMGRQDIYIGRPILPETLAPLHYGARKQLILDAINALGPDHGSEQPSQGDPDFAAKVVAWQQQYGVSEEHAVLGCVLAERAMPVAETRALLGATRPAELDSGPTGVWLAALGRRILGWG